ncbi:MAG: (Fe-S)-binding protein [Acidobacteriaceae bacterium]|nr:(Fe-S)-binding protein [Acidobacteriaceae bacterium]MBV8570018.1 (Fe-S)-binding protein [Acidobacteriaceae bacterium]
MKIGLFIPCYIDAFFPQVGIATLELLQRLGHQVECPRGQTCCGQPMANSGDQHASSETEAHFAACFRDYETIVGPSGSCVHHIRYHLDACEQTPEVVRVRKAVRELIEFLHDDLQNPPLPPVEFPHKVGLHNSCAAVRGLRQEQPSEIAAAPRYSKSQDLLKQVKGLQIVPMDRPDECCGFGGSFSVTDEAVSSKMGLDRSSDFLRHGAEYIASGDMSCLIHLRGIIERQKMPLKVVHIAQILNGGPFA